MMTHTHISAYLFSMFHGNINYLKVNCLVEARTYTKKKLHENGRCRIKLEHFLSGASQSLIEIRYYFCIFRNKSVNNAHLARGIFGT